MDLTRHVLSAVEQLRPWHEDFYQDLHQHPELSFHETRTAGLVADRLRDLGYEVHTGIGTTGVVGLLPNGAGKTVLARAEMDALPVLEISGLPYASTATAADEHGRAVPVMHACGHDMHVTCLLAVAQLLATHRDAWSGTFVALFQPAEEIAAGARAMVEGGLTDIIDPPDVVLAQHVMPLPHDTVACRAGPALSAADSIKVTVHGKGAHGSMPHTGVDPVVLASAIVLRLNTLVSREVKPGEFAVVTVGSVQSGSRSNIIPEDAVLLLNIRAYDPAVRQRVLDAIERIVAAECEASGSPQKPDFEYYQRFPVTDNSPQAHRHVSAAFERFFADKAVTAKPFSGSEDFSLLADAFDAPYLFWFWGGFDPRAYAQAEADGHVGDAVPSNHSGNFAPVMRPTMDTGIKAMAVAVMSYLGESAR